MIDVYWDSCNWPTTNNVFSVVATQNYQSGVYKYGLTIKVETLTIIYTEDPACYTTVFEENDNISIHTVDFNFNSE